MSEVTLDEPEAKTEALLAILSEELQALGFAVVDAETVRALRDRVAREEGGYFDPNWGAVVRERWKRIDVRFHETAEEELGCQAVASSRVVRVEAPYWNGGARWDRTEWTPGYALVGYLPAFSYELFLRDGSENEIYYGVGGIQIGVQIEDTPTTDPHFDDLDVELVLADEQANRGAVLRALEDLARERERGER